MASINPNVSGSSTPYKRQVQMYAEAMGVSLNKAKALIREQRNLPQYRKPGERRRVSHAV